MIWQLFDNDLMMIDNDLNKHLDGAWMAVKHSTISYTFKKF